MHSPGPSSAAQCARRNLDIALPVLALLFLAFSSVNKVHAASATPTTTTLSAPTAGLPNQSICVLTATVTAGGAPVTTGLVTFREGAAPLGTAVLQSNGTATLRTALPPGLFSITASFSGSNAGAPSVSSPQTVTQLGQSSTTLVATGSPGANTLSATVTGNQAASPSGTVTFKDLTANTVLGTVPLALAGVQSSINTYFDGYGVYSEWAGDFNGDGRTDYAQIEPYPAPNNIDLIVNLANADGSFGTLIAVSFNSGIPPAIRATGDFNGDGFTDLVVSQYDSSSNTYSVYILLSDGNGGFTQGNGVSGISELGSILVAGDFNGDGKLDIVDTTTPAGSSGGTLLFIPGDGNGNLGTPQTSIPNVFTLFGAADFNGDGNLDLLLNPYNPSTLGNGPETLFLGQGNGTGYTALPQTNFGGYAPIPAPIVADFNGDGIPDLALYNGTDTVTILLGDGKGNFAPAPNAVTNVGSHASGAGLAMDINGDGIMDLVLFVQDLPASENNGQVPTYMLALLGDGTGRFSISPEVSQAPDGSFQDSPVAFTLPSLGNPLIVPVQPVLGNSTATLSGVNVENGITHSIVAVYDGDDLLPGSTSQPAVLGQNVGFSQGFAAGSVQINGSAALAGSAIELTSGQPNQTGSFFYPQQVDIRGFVTDFDFQLTNAQADGFTFTIQTLTPYALGGTGGSLGYAGIQNSLAIKFDLFDNAGEGSDSTGLFTNGAMPTTPSVDLTSTGIDLHSGHVLHARILYGNGNTLRVILSDPTTGKTAEQDYTINFVNVFGSTTTAYVGFTGSTGGLTATQRILDWTYSPLPNYVIDLPQGPTPYFTANGLAMNGSARIVPNYNELRLIDSGVADQASSAYFTSPVDIRQFTTDFTFQASNAIADGFTFVLQNAGPNAVGPSGGGLGYGPDTPYGNLGGGIPQSAAVKFDLFSNVGEGADSTGVYLDGASPTLPATDIAASGVSLTSHDILDAHLVYNGTVLTVTITDTVTGASATQSYTVNIPAAVGANTALAGFTAGTGALSAQETILTWTYEPTD